MISGQKESVLVTVVNRESELAVNLVEEVDIMLLVQMQQDFNVRLGPKSMPLLDQYFFQFEIVENPAIAHQHHGTVFVVDWLVATLQIDNAQAPKAQRHIMADKISGGVRATMVQLVGHAHQQLCIRFALTAHVNKAYQATHSRFTIQGPVLVAAA